MNDRFLVLDTDILVDYLRGYDKAVAYVSSHADRIVIPAIVAGELYAGVKGDKELQVLDGFMGLFRIIQLSPEIARTGGLLRRDYGQSHGVGLADAMIAATAQIEDADLMTLNTKHYPMFKGLRPPYRKP